MPVCYSVLGQDTESRTASDGYKLVPSVYECVFVWVNGTVTLKHFGSSEKVEKCSISIRDLPFNA